MSLLWKPMRLLCGALIDDVSPRQVAWGLSLGMVIGLVPKGNLTAISLMAFVAMLRVNLAALTLSSIAFTMIGSSLDGMSHQLGVWALELPALQTLWTWLYNQPVVPWTSFNNTVVLGSFCIAVAWLLPFHLLIRRPIALYFPRVQQRLAAWRIVHWMGVSE